MSLNYGNNSPRVYGSNYNNNTAFGNRTNNPLTSSTTYATGGVGGGGSNYNYYSYQQGHTNNSNMKIGSYRIIKYENDRLPAPLSNLQQWKESIPISAACREETIHLTPTQLRVEDYFNIRNKNLESKHSRGLDGYIDKGAFNRELLNANIITKPLISFGEQPPHIDAVMQMAGNVNTSRYGNNGGYTGTGGGYGGSGGGGGYSTGGGYGGYSSNTGGYNNQQQQSNPFMGGANTGNYGNNSGGYGNNNRNPMTSTSNPFSPSPNTNPMGSSYNTRSNNPNPYSNNTNNNNSGNPFVGNNNNNGGTRNPFQSNMGGGSGGGNNPFQNNNNNNNNNNRNPFQNNGSGGNNPFQNNNNGNPYNNNNYGNNNNNPFNNNSNNGNNPFNNNNNNRNPFQNGNNNGYNMFNNSGGYNNNGNLFSNQNNNNSGGNSQLSEFTLMQMMSMMQTMVNTISKNNGHSQQSDDPHHDSASHTYHHYNSSTSNNWFIDPFPEDIESEYLSKKKRRKEPRQEIIFINQLPMQATASGASTYHGDSRMGGMGGSRLFPRTSSINYSMDQFGGVQNKSKDNEPIAFDQNGFHTYHYQIIVLWKQCMQEEEEVTGQFKLPREPCLQELTEITLQNALLNHPSLRKDAQLILEMPRPTSRRESILKGAITHRKVNLPKGYDYIPSQFPGFQVKNLTICNQYGRVEWPGIIDISGVDFSTGLMVEDKEADIIDEKLNSYKMEITLHYLPESVVKFMPDERRMWEALGRIVSKSGENVQLKKMEIEERCRSFTFTVEPISK